MTIDDNATLVIGAGHYYTAPINTTFPEDLLAPPSPWLSVGHTSLEDILSVSSEGGEATTIGSLQNKSLRTKYSPRTETLTFTAQQWDEANLRRYYGANAVALSNGLLGVPREPEPTRAAFLSVFVDGLNHFAFYAPLAEIYRADDIDLADTESLAGLPLGVKPLIYGANSWAYAVTPLGGALLATGATAGQPGDWSPAGAPAPSTLAALQAGDVIATPTTAWATGDHVILDDTSHAYWDGTAWASGDAP